MHHDRGGAHAFLLHQAEQHGGVVRLSRTQPCETGRPRYAVS